MVTCYSDKYRPRSLSRVSSRSYSACLTPDPWLRIVVLTSGRLLWAAGVVVVLLLPLPAAVRITGVVCWCGFVHREIGGLQRGFRCCRMLRLHADGSLTVATNNDDWVAATLESGSVVIANFAWLRFVSDTGMHYQELLYGDARRSNEWRRLQVIWRHVGAAERSC